MRYICTSIVATLLLAGTSFAATINVPADYTTIQAAVDAASDGDEIIVAPGTYTGTGGEVVDMKGKAITLRASGTSDETILDGNGTGPVVRCVSGENTSTILEGFTITNGSNEYGGGIVCWTLSNPTITGCTITGNNASYRGGGIDIYNGCNPTITDCNISNNTSSNGGGIY